MFTRHRAASSSSASIKLTISSNTSNWDIIVALGFTPSEPKIIEITVAAGVVVSATSTAVPALDLFGLPSGSTVTLTNLGYIIGAGGAGGVGGNGTPGNPGGAGGNAVRAPGAGIAFDIINASGYIWGGGGGGGGGGGAEKDDPFPEPTYSGGGGGGGGAGGAAGGFGGEGNPIPGREGGNGASGTSGIGGVGGAGGSGNVSAAATTGSGGNGGAYGMPGSAGANAVNHLGTWNAYNGGSGGSAGKAVDLNGGTANFISGNSDPNVKGVVG